MILRYRNNFKIPLLNFQGIIPSLDLVLIEGGNIDKNTFTFYCHALLEKEFSPLIGNIPSVVVSCFKKIFNELDSNYYKSLVNKKYHHLI
jgi:hypothetical protein